MRRKSFVYTVKRITITPGWLLGRYRWQAIARRNQAGVLLALLAAFALAGSCMADISGSMTDDGGAIVQDGDKMHLISQDEFSLAKWEAAGMYGAPDPWDNPEFKNLTKPQTEEHKKQEAKDAKHRHETGSEFSDIAAGERPTRSAWDGITGGGRTKEAIKSVVSDPDSVQLESSTSPWVGQGRGGACWIFKVAFRYRNGFGGYTKSVAMVYWRNGEVIDCVIDF